MFSIDDFTWPYPCDIARVAEVRSSEASGELLSGEYFNDVLGTYMQYTVKLVVPMNHQNEYARIYQMLTDPVDGHTFSFPYNFGQVQITGRVSDVSDVYVRLPAGGMAWRGIQFTVTANHPTRAYTQQQAINRGMTPLPEVAEHNEGDTWVWTDGTWELSVSYGQADTTRY